MRWKFRKHRMANVAALVIILLYAVALFVEPVAPYHPDVQDVKYAYRPPTQIHFFDTQGKFHPRPFVYGTSRTRDLETLSLVYAEDKSQMYSFHLFVKGAPYTLWGIIKSDRHLIGLDNPEAKFYLFGGDSQGRDVFSRVI